MENFFNSYDLEVFGDEFKLEKHEARLLLDDNYVSKIKETYPQMIVLVIPKLSCVRLRGTKKQIEHAKTIALETVKKSKN